jgi:hypothetical protein
MGNIFYFSYFLILAGLFVYVLRLQGVQKLPRALLLLVIFGLVYDNGMCSAGFLIGEGQVLKWLTIPRFVLHVFLTPLICVICLKLSRGARVPAALTKSAAGAAWALAIVLMAVGYFQDLASLDLAPRSLLGVVTYTHPKSMPPIAAIVVNFLSIAASILIWRRTRWPWLFITSVLMLLLGGFPQKYFGLIPGNAGEIIFVSGFILGLKRLTAVDRPAGQSV